MAGCVQCRDADAADFELLPVGWGPGHLLALLAADNFEGVSS